jgi:hypothetical protein
MKEILKRNETARSTITRQSHKTTIGDSQIDSNNKSILIRSPRITLEFDK